MKKLILCLFFVGCNVLNVNLLNPPEWILGKWSDEYSFTSFEFTFNNVILTSAGYEIDFNETLTDSKEIITDKLYEIITDDCTYSFIKINDYEIEYVFDHQGIKTSVILING